MKKKNEEKEWITIEAFNLIIEVIRVKSMRERDDFTLLLLL